ncbi:hypothetical protein RH915_10870 [Serpentinicella sp. ANB-PHB4]|uniref:hypothetical protein n=1 Tax=Serpentinicella sp. ANB-PHB4 TaxID=3074076 RepID=UPI00285DA4B7|nr:hypothetical protein [Serpentinicella sp. ANB-PHB4]MDR5659991.1 hypothetical protein [Serpentinicella sp. ANB-PHB4]
MELLGEIVLHKAFGKGKVTLFENNYITVMFEKRKEEKKFVYPDAVGAFLELENESLQQRIEKDKQAIVQQEVEAKELKEEQAKLEAEKLKSKATKGKRTKKTS